MTQWNPNEPNVVGPEFLGTLRRMRQPTRSSYAMQKFKSNSAETIANLRLNVVETVVSGSRAYLAEIFADGDEIMADPSTGLSQSRFVPNAFTNNQGHVRNEAGTGVNLQQSIDDGDTSNFADYLVFPGLAGPFGSFSIASVDLELSTAAFAPGANRRIVAVAFLLTTVRGFLGIPAGSDGDRTFQTAIVNGGSAYGPITKIVPPIVNVSDNGRAWFNYGEINPVTGLPWTIADVTAFDSGTNRLRIYGGSAGGTAYLANVNMVVVYESADRRLAYATHTYDGSGGWTANIAVKKADATANWAKGNATSYVLTVREADAGDLNVTSPATALSLSCVETVPGYGVPADLDGDDWITSTTNDQSTTLALSPALPLIVPETESELFPTAGRSLLAFVLMTSAPAVSADCQPYRNVSAKSVSTTSGSNESEFRTNLTHTYSTVRFVGGHSGVVPSDELVVEIRRRSDSALMGSARVQPEDAAVWMSASGDSSVAAMVLEAVPDAAVSLVSGTQYYVKFTSATDDDKPWLVSFMGLSDTAYEVATYGGVTDQAGPIGGFSGLVWGDFAFLVDLAVDAPTSFAVASEVLALPDDQDAELCPLTGIPYALVSWDATALGASFDHYTIQRLGEDGATWETIASITTEAVTQFDDQEGRIGIQECYRMRVVRSDGAVSAWTTSTCVTLASVGCGYTFTTNEAPELAVGYPDTYQAGQPSNRDYQFPDGSEIRYREMHGRDYQVVFRRLAEGGVTFSRQLNIAGFAAPSVGVGPKAADLLRTLSKAAVSYVCVRDNAGNRFYSSIAVPSLSVLGLSDSDSLHSVRVNVAQVTGTPSQPDATT